MKASFDTGDSIAFSQRILVEVAVRRLLDRLRGSWHQGDGASFANCFTPDATYVAINGTSCEGRAAIERHGSENAFTIAAMTTTKIRSERISHPGGDVALVYAEGSWIPPRQYVEVGWVGTLVAVLTSDREWLFVSFHGMQVKPLAPVIYPMWQRLKHQIVRSLR